MHVHVCVQESVEDMGLYEDVSGAGGATVQVKVTSLLHVIYCTCSGILTCALLCFIDNGLFMCMPVCHCYTLRYCRFLYRNSVR